MKPGSDFRLEVLVLLAYLNSSTTCFWLKQVSQSKGSLSNHGKKWPDEPAKVAYEFSVTQLHKLPVPKFTEMSRQKLLDAARRADKHAQDRQEILRSLIEWIESGKCGQETIAPADAVARARALDDAASEQIIASQENIDWIVYKAIFSRLVIPDVTFPERVPLGARPFEINLVTEGQQALGIDGQALRRTPPEAWPPAQRDLWNRLAALSRSKHLGGLETPEFKRRFAIKTDQGAALMFEDRARYALYEFVSSRVEDYVAQVGGTVTAAVVSKHFETDPVMLRVGTLATEHGPLGSCPDLAQIAKVLESDSVPYLPQMIFQPSGLEKHQVWRAVWDAQRREDAEESVGNIPLPPKYRSTDYLTARYWELRGKLDVPQERFVSYPGLESNTDNQPIYGWAGWNHAQRAQVLLDLYANRKDTEGWTTERLMPILVGVHELIPWIKQWHNEHDEDTGERRGDAYDIWLSEELRIHGLTRNNLDAWRPSTKSAAKKAAVKTLSTKNSSTLPPPTERPMKFRLLGPRASTLEPFVGVLQPLHWDDFGYRVLFHLSVRLADLELKPIGLLKILQRKTMRPALTEEFEQFDARFCSLGQTQEFYENLRAALGTGARNLLSALRDLTALSESERESLVSDQEVDRTLLRLSSARHAYAEQLGKRPDEIKFRVSQHIRGFARRHEVHFRFHRKGMLGRMIVLVGQNGTGKSQFLRGLVYPVLGIWDPEKDEIDRTPPLSRLVLISLSAFDQFRIPRTLGAHNVIPYMYCGLRRYAHPGEAKVIVDVESAFQEIQSSYSDLCQRGHKEEWEMRIRTFGLRPPQSDYFVAWLNERSAGEKAVCFVLTMLLANLRQGAVVLFDEPETHTHPKMLALLMRQLGEILKKFDAYAIVATHSPIVLQEIPARQVHVFHSDGEPAQMYPRISAYPRECFGESLDDILKSGFGIELKDANYMQRLRELVREYGVETVEKEFYDSGLATQLAIAWASKQRKPSDA